MNNTQKTAIIYTRVSSTRQSEEGVSLDSQEILCKKKVLELGATLLKTFIEKGVSGRTANRPEFQNAITFCEKHHVDYFIIFSSSRFARNRYDAINYKIRLEQAGTEIVYVDMPLDRKNHLSVMLEAVIEAHDQAVSDQISADTRRAMAHNASLGYWNGGYTPFGYTVTPDPINPKKRRLTINPAEATLVRIIYEKRLEGKGGFLIANWLNANGHLNRGRLWNKATVTALLRSPASAGKRLLHGEPDELINSHPAIVTEHDWQMVQRLMNEGINPNTGSPLSRHLLTGIARCGYCGASIQIENAKSSRYFYYGCRNVQKKGKNTCAMKRKNTHTIDDMVLTELTQKLITPTTLTDILTQLNELTQTQRTKRTTELEEINQRLRENQTATNNLLAVAEKMGIDTPDGVLEKIRQHGLEKKQLQERVFELGIQPTPTTERLREEEITELARFLKESIYTLPPVQVRAILSTFVAKVELTNELITIFYSAENLLSMREENIVLSEGGAINKWLLTPSPLRTININLPQRVQGRIPNRQCL